VNGGDVVDAAADCQAFLSQTVEHDWSVQIPDMEWTVATVVAHISDCLLWYASDMTAGETELSTVDLRVRPESAPADLVRTIGSFAQVLARVIDGAPPDERGWHPWGNPDASGYAAMACDELLVHTDDVARGLGLRFATSPELARATVRRLFPWAPTRTDPWQTLLWANGRVDLPDRERQTNWRWHSAPLAEWDGTHLRGKP
jgi:uncharacterized protein (TIGR03083 family)